MKPSPLDSNYKTTKQDNSTQGKSEAKRLRKNRYRVKSHRFPDGHTVGSVTYSPHLTLAGRTDKDLEEGRDYLKESLARSKSNIDILVRHNALDQMVTITNGDTEGWLTPSEALGDVATFLKRQGKRLSIGKVLTVAGRGSKGRIHIHAGVSDGRCWGKGHKRGGMPS